MRNITAFCQHLLCGHFGRYQYISEIQISAQYISQAKISVYLYFRALDQLSSISGSKVVDPEMLNATLANFLAKKFQIFQEFPGAGVGN